MVFHACYPGLGLAASLRRELREIPHVSCYRRESESRYAQGLFRNLLGLSVCSVYFDAPVAPGPRAPLQRRFPLRRVS